MKKTHVTLVLLFLCISMFLFAKNSSAKSKEQPYELSVQILQNADNIAEVTIDIDVIKDGYSAPTTAKQIKLKPSSGKKTFKNETFKNVALTPKTDGSGSSVVLQYDNAENADSIQVTVKIKNSEANVKLKTTGEVLLLPDLTVSEIDVKSAIVENQETTITAKISELNDDMEASADVSLLIGETVIGTSSVTVKPGKSEDVDFETTFDTTGSYNVTVRISNVQPEDFDETNNVSSATAEVYTIPEALALNENLNYVFDINALPSVTITITTNEWDKQLVYYDSNPRHEEYSKADFELEKNGESTKIEDIGFRVRGNEFSRKRPEGDDGELHDSESPDWHRAHLKINFTEYDKDDRFLGLRGLNLKYFNNDNAYIREVYCFDLFKKFKVWTAPLSSYARVYIKIKEDEDPAYFGVFNIVESIDKEFIQDRFGKKNDEGYLWKCLYPADLTSNNLDTDEIGTEKVSLNEEDSFRPAYDLKTNKSELEEAKLQLIQFIDDMNSKEGDEFVNWIQSSMDVDLLLKTLAVHVLLGSWDDYWLNVNNYYLYFDESGKAYYIPYDYDLTLGISYYLDNTGTQDVMKWGVMNNSRPLVYKILSVQQFRDQYKSYLQDLIDESNDYFDYGHSVARINAWHAMIKDYIVNDTGEMTEIADQQPDWSNATFYRLLNGDESGAEPEANWFKTRSAYALDQIMADAGWTSEVAPITADLYLSGTFNDWEVEEAYKFFNEDSVYSLEISFSENDYNFRIADESWNENTNFGAPKPARHLTIGELFYSYSQFSDPFLYDIEMEITQAGTYRFEFDATDSENPTLLVTRVE